MNENTATYERAVKHVKKIKSFHRHILAYFIFNIVIVGLGFKFAFDIVDATPNADKGFVNWMYLNVWSTPILWGIGLIIHGLYVYRFKFSFFKNWEERKIKELIEKDDERSTQVQKWE